MGLCCGQGAKSKLDDLILFIACAPQKVEPAGKEKCASPASRAHFGLGFCGETPPPATGNYAFAHSAAIDAKISASFAGSQGQLPELLEKIL